MNQDVKSDSMPKLRSEYYTELVGVLEAGVHVAGAPHVKKVAFAERYT